MVCYARILGALVLPLMFSASKLLGQESLLWLWLLGTPAAGLLSASLGFVGWWLLSLPGSVAEPTGSGHLRRIAIRPASAGRTIADG